MNFVYEARPVGGALTPSDEHPELVWMTKAEIEAADAEGRIRGGHVAIAVGRSAAGVQVDDPLTEVEGRPGP